MFDRQARLTLHSQDPISLPTASGYKMAVNRQLIIEAALVSVRRIILVDHLGVQDFHQLTERFPFIKQNVEVVTITLELSDGTIVSPLSDAANRCPRLCSLHVIISLQGIYGPHPAIFATRFQKDACKHLDVLVGDFKRIRALQSLRLHALGVSGRNERLARELLNKIEKEVVQRRIHGNPGETA